MPRERPPVILVHGAANSGGVWAYWQVRLADHGWRTAAINFRGHGDRALADLSQTSMKDYSVDLIQVVRKYQTPPVIGGWSMGGLVAMMAAQAERVAACVCLAPSMPSKKVNNSVPLRTGVLGPEEYGIANTDPTDQPNMPDLDQAERAVALARGTSHWGLVLNKASAGRDSPGSYCVA